MFGGKVLRTVR